MFSLYVVHIMSQYTHMAFGMKVQCLSLLSCNLQLREDALPYNSIRFMYKTPFEQCLSLTK